MKPHWLFLILIVGGLVLGGCSQTPQQKRDRHLETGKRMFLKKDYARAMLEFKNAVQAMPRDAESYYQLGLAYQALDDLRLAAVCYGKATQLDPKHAGAQMSYAEILTITRNAKALTDAESRLKDVLSLTPDDPRALNDLALVEFKLGRPEDAEKELAIALEKAPSYVQTYVNTVRVKLKRQDVAGVEDTLKQATQAAPKSLTTWILLERFYVATRRFPLAEVQLHKALEIDPKSMEALMELGRIQLATDRQDEAEKTFKKVSELPDPSAKTIHARFLLHQGKTDAGIAELEQLFQKDSKVRGVRSELINAYMTANRAGDAERLITEALKRNPKDVDSLLQRVTIYLREGKVGRNQSGIGRDITEALHYQPNNASAHYLNAKLHRGRGQDLLARQELGEALRLDPQMLRVRLELADSLLSAGDTKGALEILDAAPSSMKQSEALLIERNWALIAAKRYPEARASVKLLLAKSQAHPLLVQDGLLKMQANDVTGAQASLQAAIDSNPGDLQALQALVHTYPQKQTGAAVAKIKEYALKRPDSAPLQAFLGEMLLDSGDAAGAREFLVKAQKLLPGNDTLELLIARVDIQEHRNDAARQALQELIASGRNVEQAALFLGRLEETTGNYLEAVRQYRVAAELSDKSWVPLNNLAFCLNAVGQHDEALKYAQQAKELAPNNPDVMDTLGWAYFNKGLYDAALKELGPLAGDPHAIDRYHLAMAYFKKGDVDRGRGVLQSALKIDPNLPEARVAQQMAQRAAMQQAQ